MKPTDILRDEHRVILQVLDCLERLANRCAADGRLDAKSAEQAVDFFRSFADHCHHGKEEAHLFPAMEAKGFPRQNGPTGVMLDEHERGRGHVRGMAGAIPQAALGDAEAVRQFVAHARGYVALLREHIEKEDHCLFAMADQALGDDDQQALLAAFEQVEREHNDPQTHAKYLRLADELAARFGVACPRDTAVTGCGCRHA